MTETVAPPRPQATLDDMPEFANVLYYGEPGSGKTSAAAGMARLGRVYLVDTESGAKARPLRRLGIPVENIIPARDDRGKPITTYSQLDAFYWRIKAELDDDPDSVAGVIFDSMTELHQMLLREEVDVRHAKAVRKATDKNGVLLMEVEDSEFDVDVREHGVVTEKLRVIARRFRDLPCHTAFVCLAKREVDKESGTGLVMLPQLSPKFGVNLMGYVDLIAYTSKVPGVEDASGYLGVFRDTGKYKGKDRLGGTPSVLADPSFDRLVALVFQDWPLDDDPAQQDYLDRVRAKTSPAESAPPADSK